MSKIIPTIVDPVTLVDEVHKKISAEIDRELAKEHINVLVIDAYNKAGRFLNGTLRELMDKAKQEVNSNERGKES